MAYITFKEFSDISTSNISEDTFNEHSLKAEVVLDNVTQHFYQFNELEHDIPFRRDKFKQAVASQVEFFDASGSSRFSDIFDEPDSFSVGRTSITSGKSSRKEQVPSIVANDVYLFLEGTGLLYRGVN